MPRKSLRDASVQSGGDGGERSDGDGGERSDGDGGERSDGDGGARIGKVRSGRTKAEGMEKWVC